jgi:cytochrome c-type biogenesis protein CcmH/NrfG
MEQFQQWQDSHHAQAMELAPDNARYAFVYAVALPDTGALQRGIEALEHMLQRQPDNGKLVSALINWSLEQRDYARAKQYMSHFEQPHPNDAALMQWR